MGGYGRGDNLSGHMTAQGLPAQGLPAQGLPAQGLPAQGLSAPSLQGDIGQDSQDSQWPSSAQLEE